MAQNIVPYNMNWRFLEREPCSGDLVKGYPILPNQCILTTQEVIPRREVSHVVDSTDLEMFYISV